MMRLRIGYPSVEAELEILEVHGADDPVADLQAVTDAQEVAGMIDICKRVHAAQALKSYVVHLVRATRTHPSVELGASPRASLALLRACRTKAAVEARDYVVPDDVKTLAHPLLAHRLVMAPEAQMAGTSAASVVEELLETVPIPGRR
jgi:MoxR-like ATPase